MSGRKQSNSFTLMAKPAATVIYTLACSPDSIAFRSDATGSFAANADKVIMCRVKKNKGNEQTDVSLSNGTYDGLYLKYRKVFAYGTSGNWIASNQVTISYSDPVNNGVIGVEFCLATDSAVTDIIVSRVVSIVCDGNIGPTGGLGRMILPMGVWSSSTIYSSTAFHTPLVYYAGEYWYLNADTDQGTTPADTAGNPWTMARNFGMVITEAIFAPFAKFGGAIFAGNIIFSANGSIDGTDYVDGQEWKGYPAWSLFVGDPSEKAIKSGGTLNTYSYYTSSVALIPATTLAEGELLVLKLTLYSASAGAKIKLFTVTSGSYQFEYNTSGDTWTKTSELAVSANQTIYIRFAAPIYYTYQFRIKTSASGSVTYSCQRLLFEPVRFENLITGKVSGARGNFILHEDGSVTMKNAEIRGSLMYRRVKTCDVSTYTGNVIAIDCQENGGLLFDTVLIYGTYGSDKTVYLYLPPASTCVGASFEIRNVTSEWSSNSQAPSSVVIAVQSDIDAGPTTVVYSGETYYTNRFVTPFMLYNQFGSFESLSVPTAARRKRLTFVATSCPKWGALQTTDTYVWLLLEAD